jgi:FkbM family methyltransferase
LLNAHGHPIWVRTDDLRSYWIWRSRGTQPNIVRVWESLLSLEPELAIDVGANYGEFSLSAAGKVPLIAIEANPQVCAELQRSLGGYDSVTVLNLAASNVSKEIVLHVPSGWSGGSSLSEEVVANVNARLLPRSRQTGRVKLRTNSIDKLIAARSVGSVILKIDVEGFDREVLEGATETVNHARWWRAIIEFDPAVLSHRGESVPKVWQYFARYPGMAIERSPVPAEAVARLDSRLPAEPPGRANLVIGEGSPL